MAVQKAFEYLGFDVTNSDSLPEHKDRKREDLRVAEGDWIALVEVNGYGGAAKSNDLQQLNAAAVTFAIDQGKLRQLCGTSRTRSGESTRRNARSRWPGAMTTLQRSALSTTDV